MSPDADTVPPAGQGWNYVILVACPAPENCPLQMQKKHKTDLAEEDFGVAVLLLCWLLLKSPIGFFFLSFIWLAPP